MTSAALEAELDWLLKVDVGATLNQLKHILSECTTRFHTPSLNSTLYNLSQANQNQLDSIRIKATLNGYRITNSDIVIKLASRHPVYTIKTCINECPEHPFPWTLYQIQDSTNHLSYALDLLENAPLRLTADNKYDFESGEEISQLIEEVMNHLQKSRNSLLVPKKRNLEELQCSQNMQSIKPSLPIDFTISFYIQAHKLICSIYQLIQTSNGPQIKSEYQSEVSVPFLSEVLVFLSLGIQTCQQMKDKVKTLETQSMRKV